MTWRIIEPLRWQPDDPQCEELLGVPMPAPWDTPGADDPDQAMRLASDHTVAGIVQLCSSRVQPKPLSARLL